MAWGHGLGSGLSYLLDIGAAISVVQRTLAIRQIGEEETGET